MDAGLGYFGDVRRGRCGEFVARRMTERQTVCIRHLADDRAEQLRLRRFLANEAVTVEEMVAHRAMFVAAAAKGRHVLAIQDTSEINYQAQKDRKRRLGKVGNGTDVGLFVHPVLGVDADSGECLGLIDAQVWRRTKSKAANYKALPIEQKESYRWLIGGAQAKAVLAEAAMVTVIDDREADIYEKWDRLPDASTYLLTRASRDRALADGGRLFATLATFPQAHRFTLDVQARPGKHGARQAVMAVRLGRVRIRRPTSCSDRNASAEIELSAIEVRELNPPSGQTQNSVALADHPYGRDSGAGTHRDRMVSSAMAHRTAVPNPQATRAAGRGERDRGRRNTGKTRDDCAHCSDHHHAAGARACGRKPGAASQSRLHSRTERGAPCSAEEAARTHAQAAQPICPKQPRLGCLDHRTPRRLDRIRLRSLQRSYNHAGRARTTCRHRRWIHAREKCVPKLAPCGGGRRAKRRERLSCSSSCLPWPVVSENRVEDC